MLRCSLTCALEKVRLTKKKKGIDLWEDVNDG